MVKHKVQQKEKPTPSDEEMSMEEPSLAAQLNFRAINDEAGIGQGLATRHRLAERPSCGAYLCADVSC